MRFNSLLHIAYIHMNISSIKLRLRFNRFYGTSLHILLPELLLLLVLVFNICTFEIDRKLGPRRECNNACTLYINTALNCDYNNKINHPFARFNLQANKHNTLRSIAKLRSLHLTVQLFPPKYSLTR